ncbi:MAG: amidohydrolase family protein [Anaerolineaceae bacterium]|nr:amidohydrolase family protein [Anaerolineaceae bacterium]
MTKILIKNVDVIATMDAKGNEYTNHDILLDGQTIEKIDRDIQELNVARTIDGRGKIAFPGFVNVHHHMYQIFTRDLTRILGARGLFDWLEMNYLIWGSLTEEMVYVSALTGLALLMKTGCTLASDMYYIFPRNASKKLIDAQIQAARELGLRFHPTRGAVSSIEAPDALAPPNVCQTDDEILQDYERLVNTYHNPDPFSMLRIGLAPVNPVTSTESLLIETIKFARKHDLRCHTHLAESPQENEWSMNKHGMREFDYMESIGWVGPDVWYAHCLYLTDDEIERMGKYNCGMAHCPICNTKNAVIAPIFKMMDAGIKVGFGVDGMGGYGDMVTELQTALTLHTYRFTKDGQRGKLGLDLAREMLRIASKGGAEVLGWDEVGSLEPGKAADIVLFNVNLLDFAGCTTDLVTSFVSYGSNHKVDTSIINGEVVIDKGELCKVDEHSIVERANSLSKDFLERARKETGIDYTKARS